jgi:polyhydroxyalkanoate synthase
MRKPNEIAPTDAPTDPVPEQPGPEKAASPKSPPPRSWRGPSGQTSSAHRAYGLERTLLGTHIPETIDRMVNANLARGTGGISPAVLAMAYLDWLMHLGLSPGKQALLNEKAVRKMVRLALYAFKSSQNPETRPASNPCPKITVSMARAGGNGPIT